MKKWIRSIVSLVLALTIALSPSLGVYAATVETLPANRAASVTVVETKSTMVWVPTHGGEKISRQFLVQQHEEPAQGHAERSEKRKAFTACKKCY